MKTFLWPAYLQVLGTCRAKCRSLRNPRCEMRSVKSHIPPVLPTHFKQRICDLPQRAHEHGSNLLLLSAIAFFAGK